MANIVEKWKFLPKIFQKTAYCSKLFHSSFITRLHSCKITELTFKLIDSVDLLPVCWKTHFPSRRFRFNISLICKERRCNYHHNNNYKNWLILDFFNSKGMELWFNRRDGPDTVPGPRMIRGLKSIPLRLHTGLNLYLWSLFSRYRINEMYRLWHPNSILFHWRYKMYFYKVTKVTFRKWCISSQFSQLAKQ